MASCDVLRQIPPAAETERIHHQHNRVTDFMSGRRISFVAVCRSAKYCLSLSTARSRASSKTFSSLLRIFLKSFIVDCNDGTNGPILVSYSLYERANTYRDAENRKHASDRVTP